jgi:pimeloyl-ACP methyl ester carboxylesterase
MKHFIGAVTLLLAVALSALHAQTPKKPVYVIVHGAWGGGWAFRDVEARLRDAGAIVYRPTLTGQGERVHLATTDIRLKTHILDVVNVVLYEDLREVILVGHSYGGMVITGVADSLASRIKTMVYLDAAVPENGENMNEALNFPDDGFIKNVNGFFEAPWVRADQPPPKDVPHPAKTWTDPIVLKNPARLNIPSVYILTVEKGMPAASDDFFGQSERARKKGWKMFQLEADHNPQWSKPAELVKMLVEVSKGN